MSVTPETQPAAQEGQPQSSLAYPVEQDRIFCGWESMTALLETDSKAVHTRRGPQSRTTWYCFIGIAYAALFRLMAYKRKLQVPKAGFASNRFRLLPLGSHAPPSAVAA